MRDEASLPPLHGEGRRSEAKSGWGSVDALLSPTLAAARPPLPIKGRESGGALIISGYASLWGQADLNGDVVSPGAFKASLQRTGPEGVRMLHGHEARVVVGVWETLVEDERGLFVRGRIEDWSAEARYAQSLARAGALDGLSIGFRTAKARRDGRLRVLSAVELWEVSLVTFPMLPAARFRVGV
ncbi:MAG: HK97 family phage prohead protease [Brevundimonas sp.]|nr:MAG: HK97 family phage prohead protease [Brevundimonas sp.]